MEYCGPVQIVGEKGNLDKLSSGFQVSKEGEKFEKSISGVKIRGYAMKMFGVSRCRN